MADSRFKVTPYEHATAFRALIGKYCPACDGLRQRSTECFCRRCTAKLPEQMQENLHIRERFARTYHDAIKIFIELQKNGGGPAE